MAEGESENVAAEDVVRKRPPEISKIERMLRADRRGQGILHLHSTYIEGCFRCELREDEL